MKQLIILSSFVWLTSCKKESKFENYPLKATMMTSSGKTIEATFLDSEVNFSKSDGTQGKQIILAGGKYGEYSLTLVIVKPEVGTFDLSNKPGWIGSSCNAAVPYTFPIGNLYNTWGIGSGYIRIELLTDSTIKGSFNAVCIRSNDTLRITNGTFSGPIY